MNDIRLQEMVRTTIYRRRVFTAVAIGLGVAVLLLFLYGTAEVLLLLFIAVLLAIIFSSLSHWLATHTPLSRNLSLAFVVMGLLLALVLVSLLIGPSLAYQFDQLIQQLPQSLGQIESWLRQYGWGRQLLEQVPNSPSNVLSGENASIFSRLTGILSTTSSVIANSILLFFTGLFFAVEPKTYVDGMAQLVPPSKRQRAKEVMYAVGDTLRKWLVTRFISIITVGVITTVGLYILNVPLALSLGIIAGLLALVPTIGPIIALLPAVLIGFLQSPQTALYVFALYILAQSVDNYLVTPFVVKQTIRIPPALIISAQLIGGVLFGEIGVIMAAPLGAAVMTFTQMVYINDFLERHDSYEEEGGKPD